MVTLSTFCRRFLLALSLLATSLAWAEPLGMVTDLVGKVWFFEGAVRKPLTILAYLEQGITVEVEAGAKVSVTYYNPPGEFVFSSPTQFQVVPKAPRIISGPAPTTNKLSALAASASAQEISGGRRTQAALRMRSLGGISGMAPNQTVVREMPRFVWRALPGVERYQLTLLGKNDVKVASTEVSGNEWEAPASVSLEPGVEYTWVVDATLANGSTISGKARFGLLDGDSARKLASEAPKPDAPFAQRLQFAMTLDSLGLFDEARALWRELAKERPDEPLLKRRAQ